MKIIGAPVPEDLGREADAMAFEGLSPVYVSVERECVGLAGMGDPVRPEAKSAIDALRRRGWRISVLSGDHPQIVESMARTLGIDPADCRAGVTPEGKLEVVREMVGKHTTVMVGDGVNDAAALAAATVGISVRGGAEASLAAADVSLSREGLTPIVDLLEGARRTMRTIHWTIAASLAYNVLAATLSIMGMISPLLAAFIMPASSFTVLTICVRSGAFRVKAGKNRNEEQGAATEWRGTQGATA
jgi:Cu2+-exporting ATPase